MYWKIARFGYHFRLTKWILCLELFSLFSMGSIISGIAYPDEETNFDSHDSGILKIQCLDHNPTEVIFLSPTQSVSFVINATGMVDSLVLKFNPEVLNNSRFLSNSSIIYDNRESDLDPSPYQILSVFNLTAPEETGSYEIIFYCKSNNTVGKPQLADISFVIQVGASLDFLWIKIFNHMNLYLGLSALIVGTLGWFTIKRNRYHLKIHISLMLYSFFATITNISLIWDDIVEILSRWPTSAFDWIHWAHISIGLVGCLLYLIAFFQGIANKKQKELGKYALGSWWIAFILAWLIWGVGL